MDEQRKHVPGSSWARAAQKAAGTRANRYAKLEQIGKRCDADSHCTRTAQVEMTMIPLNPDTGEPTGDQQDKKVCTRHRIKYEAGSQWKIVQIRDLLAP